VTRNWLFDPLEPGAYDMVMIDPPWSFKLYSQKGEEKSAQAQYACMSLDDIKALPIADLGSENSLFWLWATNPMLPQAFDVLKAWGLRFATAGHWAKTTRHGKQAFGTGFIFRCAGEPYIIGVKGKPKTTRVVRSVVMGQVREHSRKPIEAYREAERLMPNARRADIFTREARPGWEAWGDESAKFDLPTAV
jgi:N6-adenosine-specific RNA methylase IME4